MTKNEAETRTFDFYGTTRHNLPGVHPSERMSESEEFTVEVRNVYNEDGEITETQNIPKQETALYDAVKARARNLLSIWPDQDGIRIHESGASDADDLYMYREVRS